MSTSADSASIAASPLPAAVWWWLISSDTAK
jgi:hypothetical protein